MLNTILAFLIVLGPLVAIHEFGHFWVARSLGVKVLVYSIGFGPALLKWHDRRGTEYRLAIIPLGGYVRMADEREGEVPEADLPFAFNRQSVLARMAIVAAGPLINLLFAVFLYWIIFLQGVDTERAIIGRVITGSPAMQAGLQAGDEIRGVDGKSILDWESTNYALLDRMGDSGEMTIQVLPKGGGSEKSVTLKLDHYLHDSGADPFKSLGFLPYEPQIDPLISQVIDGGAGAKQGLKVGDRFVMADGQPIKTWPDLVDIIEAHPGKSFPVQIVRNGQPLTLTLTPDPKKENGRVVGKLGVGIDPHQKIVLPPSLVHHVNYGPGQALAKAVQKTGTLIGFTLESLGKMLRGLISVDNLSGPITIAKVAGQSAAMGWVSLVGFMALLSVSLGVLNLLPIPVLDGGHLAFYSIEGLLGRPLSEKTQMLGLRIGIALMGGLMLLAIFNDLSRLF